MHAAMGDRLSRQQIGCIDRACAVYLGDTLPDAACIERRWQGCAMPTDKATSPASNLDNDLNLISGRSEKDDALN